MNSIDLAGKLAVVTGAAKGIGSAIAHKMLTSGARVALWDVDEATGQAAAHKLASLGSAGFFQLDVTDPTSVAQATVRTLDQLGPVDILVNNAGILGPTAPVLEYGFADWQAVFAVNLNGAFLCLKALVPGMVERGYGRVVNMSSMAAKDGNAKVAGYAASKAALISLTKSMGKELAQTGVLVNAVAPAAVETEILAGMPEDYLNFIKSLIPMGRLGRVEEVANLVAWLCSEDCSFSTGAVFDLSGGRAVY